MTPSPTQPPETPNSISPAGIVTEVARCVSRRDFPALEAPAGRRDLTCGQLVRRILGTYLAATPSPSPCGRAGVDRG